MTLKVKSTPGFTIVELLIVVVVIGILAAITILSYNGIQGRAHDVAIRSDFRNIYAKLELYRLDNGSFPHFPDTARADSDGPDGSGAVFYSQLNSLDMKLSTSSYNTSTANTNLLYIASTDGQRYALLGYAKDNPTYYITDSMSKPEVYPNDGPNGSRYPGGYPGGIGDNIGLPHDTNFYYIFIRSSGGYRVWG